MRYLQHAMNLQILLYHPSCHHKHQFHLSWSLPFLPPRKKPQGKIQGNFPTDGANCKWAEIDLALREESLCMTAHYN